MVPPVPGGPACSKLPKKATILRFGAPRTARLLGPTRSVPDSVPGWYWVIYRLVQA
jgi:hypothetical protein